MEMMKVLHFSCRSKNCQNFFELNFNQVISLPYIWNTCSVEILQALWFELLALREPVLLKPAARLSPKCWHKNQNLEWYHLVYVLSFDCSILLPNQSRLTTLLLRCCCGINKFKLVFNNHEFNFSSCFGKPFLHFA